MSDSINHYKQFLLREIQDRNAAGEIMQQGDYVRIVHDLYGVCECCDYEVGIDYEMEEYEGRWWFVDRVCDRESWRTLTCGARVFEIDDWFFTSCWIDAMRQKKPPEPAWEL